MCAPRDPLAVMTSGGLPGAAEVYQDQRATTWWVEYRAGSATGQVAKFGGVENEQARSAEERPCAVSAVGAARCRWAVLVHLKNAIPNPCAVLESVKQMCRMRMSMLPLTDKRVSKRLLVEHGPGDL